MRKKTVGRHKKKPLELNPYLKKRRARSQAGEPSLRIPKPASNQRGIRLGRCELRGKVGYQTEDAALVGALGVQLSYGKAQHPYQCPECGAWHLTSRAPK